MSDFKAFQDLERQGWSDPGRVSGYVELFASASDQAIGSLLEAVSAKPKLKALDLCCGQGNVSEAFTVAATQPRENKRWRISRRNTLSRRTASAMTSRILGGVAVRLAVVGCEEPLLAMLLFQLATRIKPISSSAEAAATQPTWR